MAGFGGVEGAVEGGLVALRVDCGDDGEEVLVLVVVGFCGCDGLVEGVEEGWVVGSEGEFGYHVGEVECCDGLVLILGSIANTRIIKGVKGRERVCVCGEKEEKKKKKTYSNDPNVPPYPYTHDLSP